MSKFKRWLRFVLIGLLLFGSCQLAYAEIFRQRNVATHIQFPLMKNDGTLITGAAGLDSEFTYASDGTAGINWADCTNEAAELEPGSGWYDLSVAQSETNHQYILFQIKSSTTGAVTQGISVHTIVGNPDNFATTDDGGTINVTGGAVDTVTTATTATNLTNAPTNGDLTSTMKSSVTTAATASTPALSSAGNTAIWTVDISGYSGAKAGTYLKGVFDKLPASTIGTSTVTVANIWETDLSGYATANQAGTYLHDTRDTVATNLNTTIDSRMATFTLPANFEHLSITDTTGLVDITQTAADKVWGTTVRALTDKAGFALADSTSDAVIADAVWNGATATYGSVGTYGLLLETDLDGTISSRSTLTAQQVWEYATRILTALDEDTTTIDLNATTVGGLTTWDKTGYALSANGITDIWDKDLSGYSTASFAGTLLKGAGSAGDPWVTSLPGSYTSGQAGYIIGNNIPAILEDTGTTIPPTIATLDSKITVIDGIVDDILTDTGTTLPASLANTDSKVVVINGVADSILEDTGTTLPGTLTNIDTKIATAQADLDNPSQYKADVSGLATAINLATIDGIVDDILVDTGTTIPGTITNISSKIDTAQADLDNPNQYKATGFSTHSAADVWAVASRTITGLTAAALADFFDTNSGTVYGSAVSGSVVKEIADNAGGASLTEAGIADAVWNELQSGHTTDGSFGKYLDGQISGITASISDADIDKIWDELLSGHTTAGSSGKYLSDMYDATDGNKEGASYTGIETMIRTNR